MELWLPVDFKIQAAGCNVIARWSGEVFEGAATPVACTVSMQIPVKTTAHGPLLLGMHMD